MEDLRCIRCGRGPTGSETFGTAEPGQVGSGFWGTLSDGDVCPDCQAPAERAELARRITELVQREINRANDLGIDPGPHEAAVIELAMRLREATADVDASSEVTAGAKLREGLPAETPLNVSTPGPGTGSGVTDAPVGVATRMTVQLTGAFLTGCPLRIPEAKYGDVQRGLSDLLASKFAWSTADPSAVVGTYHSGGGFERELPMVLIRRAGDSTLQQILCLVRKHKGNYHAPFGEQLKSWRPKLIGARVDLYDLGMAILNVDLSIVVPHGIDRPNAARMIKKAVWLRPAEGESDLTPLAAALRDIARQCACEFSRAASIFCDEARQQPWIRHTDTSSATTEMGRLLWLHPVQIVRMDNENEHAVAAGEMAPPFHRQIELPGGRFVTGIGWSAVVLTEQSDSDSMAMRLIEMHYAYIALYMEIDRGLLHTLDEDRWSRDERLRQLEDDADQVFAQFMRVMEARSRIDTALAGLGGDEQATWETMNRVSRLDALIAGVDRKVEVLQKVAERRVQQATTASTRRTTIILSFLSALTVVTVSVALIGYFVGSQSDALVTLPSESRSFALPCCSH